MKAEKLRRLEQVIDETDATLAELRDLASDLGPGPDSDAIRRHALVVGILTENLIEILEKKMSI